MHALFLASSGNSTKKTLFLTNEWINFLDFSTEFLDGITSGTLSVARARRRNFPALLVSHEKMKRLRAFAVRKRFSHENNIE